MSNRPTPRRSGLAGKSAVAPPTAPQTEPHAAPVPTKSKSAKGKVSFYQHPEDTSRVRGALLYTMGREEFRTLSDFINIAVMREVERLEKTYNDGQPFGAVAAGEIPQGRPLGE